MRKKKYFFLTKKKNKKVGLSNYLIIINICYFKYFYIVELLIKNLNKDIFINDIFLETAVKIGILFNFKILIKF